MEDISFSLDLSLEFSGSLGKCIAKKKLYNWAIMHMMLYSYRRKLDIRPIETGALSQDEKNL